MHNNQYGEATLFKYLVHPSLHTVYRYAPDGQVVPNSILAQMSSTCLWLLGKKYTAQLSNSQRYNLMARAVIIT